MKLVLTVLKLYLVGDLVSGPFEWYPRALGALSAKPTRLASNSAAEIRACLKYVYMENIAIGRVFAIHKKTVRNMRLNYKLYGEAYPPKLHGWAGQIC